MELFLSSDNYKKLNSFIKQIKSNKNFELELRFGQPYNGFDIGKEQFDKLFLYVKSFAKFIDEKEECVEYYVSNDKNVKLKTIYHNGSVSSGLRKTVINRIDDNLVYNVRIDLSEEGYSNLSNRQVYRKSYRTRITFLAYNVRYDFTIYSSGAEKKYTLELEFERRCSAFHFHSAAVNCLRILTGDTVYLLPRNIKRNVLDTFGAINIPKKDLFKKVIPTSEFNYDTNIEYFITDKADGYRYCLFVKSNTEMYLISKNNEVIQTRWYISGDLDLSGNIYDGELVKDPEYNRYSFLIFDFISYSSVSLCKSNLQERIKYMEAFVSNVNIDKSKIKLGVKPYYNCAETSGFYYLIKNYNKVLDHKKTIDGFIFQPVEYGLPTLKLKLDNTIDFKLKMSESGKKFTLMCLGDVKFPIKEYNSVYLNDNIYKDGDVVEFSFKESIDGFYPIRKRSDKLDGNYIDVALNNFELIKNPFDPRILLKQYTIPFKRFVSFHIRRSLSLIKSKKFKINSINCITKDNDIKKFLDEGIKNVAFFSLCPKKIEMCIHKITKKSQYKKINYKSLRLTERKNTSATFLYCINCFSSLEDEGPIQVYNESYAIVNRHNAYFSKCGSVCLISFTTQSYKKWSSLHQDNKLPENLLEDFGSLLDIYLVKFAK